MVQADGPGLFSSEPLWSGFSFRVGIKVGDSPSDSLDNSIIVLSFSTFTMVEVPLGGKAMGIFGRGLLIVLSGMKEGHIIKMRQTAVSFLKIPKFRMECYPL